MRNDPAHKLSRAAWYVLREQSIFVPGGVAQGASYQAVVLLGRLANAIRAGRSL